MFIFDRCHRSSAAATPVKYERDIQWLTCILVMRKNEENNGTGEIGLVTPTPVQTMGLHREYCMGQSGELICTPAKVILVFFSQVAIKVILE